MFSVYAPISLGQTDRPWSVNIQGPMDVLVVEANCSMWIMIGFGLVLTVIALSLLIIAQTLKRMQNVRAWVDLSA